MPEYRSQRSAPRAWFGDCWPEMHTTLDVISDESAYTFTGVLDQHGNRVCRMKKTVRMGFHCG